MKPGWRLMPGSAGCAPGVFGGLATPPGMTRRESEWPISQPSRPIR